ncbi:hypothetical protein GW17_00000237 [Ensete ventricosum]|nr:hypothetical protein GW17_00000237 [Ensete ventricosum]
MILYYYPRFAISTYTIRYGRYIPIRQVTGTRTTRYRAVPSKIDRRRSISAVDDRLKKKSTVGGRLRKKREEEEKKKKEEGKKEYLARAPSSPACRRRPRPRPLLLPRKETEHLPTRGDRSRRPRDGEGAGAEKHGIRVQRGVQKVEESGGRLLGLVAVVVLSRRGGLPPLGFRLRLLGGVFSRLRRRFGGFGSLRSRLHLSSSNPTAKADPPYQ